MARESRSLLSRLRTTVKKITFLLNFNLNRWRLASSFGKSSNRRLSFNDRPGLTAAYNDSRQSSGTSPTAGLQRTISFPSEDDVDKRADLFISNFYKQLRIERQVSLELRYLRGNSFGSVSPSP
ncbi:hypothetical protein LguiA_010982 [Lonicera macranthoides]